VEITSSQYLKYCRATPRRPGSGGSGTLYWCTATTCNPWRGDQIHRRLDDSAAYRPFGEQLGFAGATRRPKAFIASGSMTRRS